MKNVYVTSPLLPPLEEFIPYLETLWESKILTNSGQFHQQLEEALAAYLGVKHVCLFSNGTLALLTALQTLRITGEVITTPYSFVATSHSLLWNDLTPVFADIDPVTFNIDPDRIEELITPKTTAIMPVHCYGIPCDMERIQKIADTYGLKVIYDAAHCFGVKQDNASILNYGDLSVLSFHATKVFNTFEGGAIICHDAKTKQRIDYLKNFGFADETIVMAPGINAKMNEVQAAMGLLQLKYIDGALQERAVIYQRYVELLDAALPALEYIKPASNIEWNYSYFPYLFVQIRRSAGMRFMRNYVSIISMPAVISIRLSAPSRCIATSRRRMYNISRLPMKFLMRCFACLSIPDCRWPISVVLLRLFRACLSMLLMRLSLRWWSMDRKGNR